MIYSKKLNIVIVNYCLCENKWFKWLTIIPHLLWSPVSSRGAASPYPPPAPPYRRPAPRTAQPPSLSLPRWGCPRGARCTASPPPCPPLRPGGGFCSEIFFYEFLWSFFFIGSFFYGIFHFFLHRISPSNLGEVFAVNKNNLFIKQIFFSNPIFFLEISFKNSETKLMRIT